MNPRATAVRRDAGLYGYQRALERRGFGPVAGTDEAGRGACAGPLVVAAVVLPSGKRGSIPGLADSKLLPAAAREEVYGEIVNRASDWAVVSFTPADVDHYGVHVCNLAGMRRALARLHPRPGYALTDGFPVRGLGVPGLAVRRGDRVAGCVAAASVIAKVTRDRAMVRLDQQYPQYGFAGHKGYVTPGHTGVLAALGPCSEHRFSYANVAGLRYTGTKNPATGAEAGEDGPCGKRSRVGAGVRASSEEGDWQP